MKRRSFRVQTRYGVMILMVFISYMIAPSNAGAYFGTDPNPSWLRDLFTQADLIIVGTSLKHGYGESEIYRVTQVRVDRVLGSSFSRKELLKHVKNERKAGRRISIIARMGEWRNPLWPGGRFLLWLKRSNAKEAKEAGVEAATAYSGVRWRGDCVFLSKPTALDNYDRIARRRPPGWTPHADNKKSHQAVFGTSDPDKILQLTEAICLSRLDSETYFQGVTEDSPLAKRAAKHIEGVPKRRFQWHETSVRESKESAGADPETQEALEKTDGADQGGDRDDSDEARDQLEGALERERLGKETREGNAGRPRQPKEP